MERKKNKNDHWKIWKTINALEKNKSSIFSKETITKDVKTNNVLVGTHIDDYNYHELSYEIIDILRHWANEWAGWNEWQSLLNKSSLLHEIEESIVSIQTLFYFLKRSNDSDSKPPIVVLDICCGKGICSMLLTYLAARPKYQRIFESIQYGIMIDKATQEQISWSHIDHINSLYKQQQQQQQQQQKKIGFSLEIWYGCNIHNDSFYQKLLDFEMPKDISSHQTQQPNHKFAIIGIHLCKTLSPRCISIFNLLGHHKAPFLCLAPCCLPRVCLQSKPNSTLPIHLYQTNEQRQEYQTQMNLRLAANSRKRQKLSNTDDFDNSSSKITPCWKCGQMGHFKAFCTTVFKDSNGKVLNINRPPKPINHQMIHLNVDSVASSERPYETYCQLLAKTVQTSLGSLSIPQYNDPKAKAKAKTKTITQNDLSSLLHTKLIEVPFMSNSHSTNDKPVHMQQSTKKSKQSSNENNWNANRKSTWIVCER